jgi:hypothetical protein
VTETAGHGGSELRASGNSDGREYLTDQGVFLTPGTVGDRLAVATPLAFAELPIGCAV